jgi:putative endonuclease
MFNKWSWYVYILECHDKSYYTGITWKPEIRYGQHLSGSGSKYTSKHGVNKLVYLEKHDDLYVARKREIQIKKWSRAKKEKLINRCWNKEW